MMATPEPSAAPAEATQVPGNEAAVKSESQPKDQPEPELQAVATPSASQSGASNRLTKDENKIITEILMRLMSIKDEDDNEVMEGFNRLVSRKSLPDYFEVIKNPIAFSTIRAKQIKKQYKNFKEFVADMAQIAHNAQVYNRPSAQIFSDAITLRAKFQEELDKLVEAGTITADVAKLPYLGELPDFEDSPPPNPEDEEEEEEAEVEAEEEDDDEDDEDEDDGSDDDRPRKKRRGGHRASGAAKKAETGEKEDNDPTKRRGRPPKVNTPMEGRINNILKGLRRPKRGADLMILPFEKLPDKTLMPEYYTEIKNPIAMDLIKKKAKRKKYQSVDQVVKDLILLFENAKSYNEPTSDIYIDAETLLGEVTVLAEQEKQKPDSDFVDEDGRLPVKEILHNGELWKVGDWVHLVNGNDITKPIVAQIYRTWQDLEGQKWINACWYYRPEQTVHRYEKHFFDNEVVKTGQYRDHKVEEIVDRCFVMFFTRYNKGRPRGLQSDKEVYVCEARYNEEKFRLNKIKTWASCLPDEVRDKDYEMDLFDVPRKMKKVPSPIKHLLREDAKEDDPLPKPTWGVSNAPPIVGAVHKRPREGNESPPPEPTPPPPSPLPTPVMQPVPVGRPYDEAAGDIMMSRPARSSQALQSPASATAPHRNAYGQQFGPRPSASPAPIVPQTNMYNNSPHSQYSSQTEQNGLAYNSNFSATTPVATNNTPIYNYQQPPAPRPVLQHSSSSSHNTTSSNAYNPPRPVEVYTLADQANASIPADIREQFHRDEQGRVLFYTAPPLAINTVSEEQQSLSHSLRYLADKARNKESDEKKRKARAEELEAEASERLKRIKSEAHGKKLQSLENTVQSLEQWCETMNEGTAALYKQMYGENWKEMQEQALAQQAAAQAEAMQKQQEYKRAKEARSARKEVPITGFKWI